MPTFSSRFAFGSKASSGQNRTFFLPAVMPPIASATSDACSFVMGSEMPDKGTMGVDEDDGAEDAAERVLTVRVARLVTSFPGLETCQLNGASGARFTSVAADRREEPSSGEVVRDCGTAMWCLASAMPRAIQTGDIERPLAVLQTRLLPRTVVRVDASREP